MQLKVQSNRAREAAAQRGLLLVRLKSVRWHTADGDGNCLLVDAAGEVVLGLTDDHRLAPVSVGEVAAYLEGIGDVEQDAELAA